MYRLLGKQLWYAKSVSFWVGTITNTTNLHRCGIFVMISSQCSTQVWRVTYTCLCLYYFSSQLMANKPSLIRLGLQWYENLFGCFCCPSTIQKLAYILHFYITYASYYVITSATIECRFWMSSYLVPSKPVILFYAFPKVFNYLIFLPTLIIDTFTFIFGKNTMKGREKNLLVKKFRARFFNMEFLN